MFKSWDRRTRSRLRISFGLPQIGLFASALLLAGCSLFEKTPPAAPPEKQAAVQGAPKAATPPPAVRSKRTVREAHEAKEQERVASIDPKSLIGLQPAGVERILGAPSSISRTDPSLVWTYAGQGCSFQVYFYPDLKTATFHALKYGTTAGENDTCLRNILTVRSNGPS